jgi:hypothetical protein
MCGNFGMRVSSSKKVIDFRDSKLGEKCKALKKGKKDMIT